MTEWILNNLLLTASGAGAVIFIIAKLIPNDKLKQWGFAVGFGITSAGRKAVGKGFWEKIEKFIISIGGVFLKGVVDGLSSDDNNGGK